MKITKQESRVLLGQIFYSKEQGMDDNWMEGYLIEQIERLSKLHQHDVSKTFYCWEKEALGVKCEQSCDTCKEYDIAPN